MSETSRYPELIVGALLVNPQGQLFVAHYNKIAGYYTIPGGHVEYGETVAQALARELEEETGLTPTDFYLIQVTERIHSPLYKDGRHHLVYLDFCVEGWEGTLQLDENELSEGQWVSVQEALSLPLTPSTRGLIEYYAEVGPGGPARYLPGEEGVK